MLKAKKGDLYVLGLSDENMKRLKDDQPIKFNLSELGLGKGEILIFNGRDETTMALMLERITGNKN
jgi:hypothetical protein